MLDTKQVKEYARYYRAMKKCDAMTKKLRKKCDELQWPLIDQMISEEIDKLSLKGGDTLSINSLIWPKILAKNEFGQADKKAVVAGLRKAGLDDMVTEESFNHMALAGYLRELDRAEKDLPEPLKGILEPNPVLKLNVRKFK